MRIASDRSALDGAEGRSANARIARGRLALLLVLDTLVLAVAIKLAEYFIPVSTPHGAHRAVMLGSGLLMLNLFGFYRVRHVYAFHQRTYELGKIVCFSMLMTSGLFFLMPDIGVPRSLVWTAALPTFLGHVLMRTLYHRALPLQEGLRRVLILGTGAAGEFAYKEIQRNPSLGFQVLGFIDHPAARRNETTEGLPVLGDATRLLDYVMGLRMDTLVMALDRDPDGETARAIGDCIELGCEVMSVARLTERVNRRIPVHFIGVSWFIQEISVSNRQLYQTAKRTTDILLSIVGLALTALILPAISLAIRLESPGPIFYSQIRVGHMGRAFRIFKFRSMRQDAESNGAVWAQVDDNRVTRVGRFLRQTRIDELPQLFNVLVGNMSLVGPRPERPEFVSRLSEAIPHYSRRHMVVPGVTGWAQVCYPYGASVEDAIEKLQYDFYYIKNRSLFLDAEILLRTVSIVLRKIGAR